MNNAEMIERLKAMKFNEPDLENLRKHAPEARKKGIEFEKQMKEASKISEKTLNLRFTI